MEARRLITEFIKTDKAMLEKLWDSYDFRVTLDQALIVDLEDQARWAMKHRLAGNSKIPNFLDYIYTQGLQSVAPDRVTLIR